MQPICPHCSSPIHNGAEDQCPVCGYSMHRADAIFGANEVEFTRVVEAAGALTHKERRERIRYLNELERKLSPIALGVYITDHGQLSNFRHHAHWILNHARIHAPSFGKRQQKKTAKREEGTIVELSAEERRMRAQEKPAGLFRRFATYLKDKFSPYADPVQQEWMLILVLDVQLEIACFSWGYMLDPYINPDTINSGIVKCRLLFRERAMVQALKKVMKSTVYKIAKDNNLSTLFGGIKSAFTGRKALAAAAGVSMACALQQSMAEPVFENDDYAEIVEVAPATPTPQQPAPQPTATAPAATARGSAAAYTDPPRWAPADYELLMQRKINAGYNMLIPGGQETTPAPLPSPSTRQEAFEESDTEVRGRYTEEYRPRPGRSVPPLNDPQKILTDVERNDARYLLQNLNAHCPFSIYVCIYKAGQTVPQELTAPTLIHSIAGVDEYAVLIQYGMGDNASVDLGYKSIDITDEQRHQFLLQTQEKIQAAGGGIEGLLAAMQCVKAQILPLADSFTPLTAGTGYKLSKVLEEGVGEAPAEEKEKSPQEQIMEFFSVPGRITLAIIAGVVALISILTGIWLFRQLGKSTLKETRPDYRLASRYGAGVSRHVRYLEGQEAEKAKTIF
ncbi:MAG: hypothetical protein IKK15_07225 [Akkermansia sp.]|nr:hypothetical protein [Akkermansia sp.]